MILKVLSAECFRLFSRFYHDFFTSVPSSVECYLFSLNEFIALMLVMVYLIPTEESMKLKLVSFSAEVGMFYHNFYTAMPGSISCFFFYLTEFKVMVWIIRTEAYINSMCFEK